ncbi:MAG: hypothetical protein D6690_15425 [Nitrospirae bacterium]|nr:MAG: hypothetical protein D6690_15425 [Nitrospirota bacterium]
MAVSLRVSLAAPGMSRLRFVQWLLACILVAALGATTTFWWTSQTVTAQIRQIEHNLDALRARNQRMRAQAVQTGWDLSEARLRQLPQEIDFARQLQRLESFSWTQFLNDLESAVPANVSLESVVLNFTDSSIALRGMTKTLTDLERLVERLEDHPAFDEVVLSQHAVKTISSRKKVNHRQVIAFSLTVRYERGRNV